jgi:hypothetical protein
MQVGLLAQARLQLHLAVDTPVPLHTLHVTPTNVDDRAEAGRLGSLAPRSKPRESFWTDRENQRARGHVRSWAGRY